MSILFPDEFAKLCNIKKPSVSVPESYWRDKKVATLFVLPVLLLADKKILEATVPLLVKPVRVPRLVIFVCAAVVSVPAIVVAVSAPFTSSKVLGVAVPIPTRLALPSTTNVPLSTFKSWAVALVSNICGVIFVSAIYLLRRALVFFFYSFCN